MNPNPAHLERPKRIAEDDSDFLFMIAIVPLFFSFWHLPKINQVKCKTIHNYEIYELSKEAIALARSKSFLALST